MKEIIIRLEDHIADTLDTEAMKLGVTVPEFLKFILGTLAKNCMLEDKDPFSIPTQEEITRKVTEVAERLANAVSDPRVAGMLKKPYLMCLASDGVLNCKECTMRITPEDLSKGHCGKCGADLEGMFEGYPYG